MDDLISRQKVIDTIEKIKRIAENELYDGEVLKTFNDVLNSLINIISLLPPAQPERIKARWLPIGIADAVGGESAMWGDEIAYHACDNCWQQALEKDGEEVLSDFCPHCGADMKGEDNETD